MARAAKMVNLAIEETSGVDHPAHLHEGWLVMKSADATEVQAALDTLTDDTPEEAVSETTEGTTPEEGGVDAVIAEKDARIADLEAQLAAKPDEAGEPEAEDILKSAPEAVVKMLEDVKKQAADATARAESAEAALATSVEKAADTAAVEKVRGWSHLTIDAEKVGPALRRLEQTDENLAKALEDTLASANARLAESGLFAEIGKSASPAAGGDAVAGLETIAKAAVASGDATTYEQAFAKAALENPDLYTKYLSEIGK